MPTINICEHQYDRYDLVEFKAQIVPLIHANIGLTDKNWQFVLAMIGVSNILAHIDTEHTAKLSGLFDTYPALHLEMVFQKQIRNGEVVYTVSQLDITK